MIKQAKLTSFINELTGYDTSIKAFEIRYGYQPGDLPSAWALWGPNCGGGSQTACNGNGDGQISSITYSGTEDLEVFEHLSLSGLINKPLSYNGALTIGVSVPASSAVGNGNIGYWLSSNIVTSFSSEFYTGDLQIGTHLNSTVNGGAFIPADAFMIDTKIDDGFPVSGRLRGHTVGNPVGKCRTLSNPDSIYLFDDLTTSCAFEYIQKE